MFEFGAGTLWGFPVGGNTAANPTPMKFGTLQDVSLDISGDVKQLYGQKQFPEAVARGKCKITGKSKFAAINGKMLNDLFFGQTMPAGMKKVALDETGTIATGAVTVANSAVFVQDWGVRYSVHRAAAYPRRFCARQLGSIPSLPPACIRLPRQITWLRVVLISYTFSLAAVGITAQYHQPAHGLCADHPGAAGKRLQRQPIQRAAVLGGGVKAQLCHQAGRLHHS